MEHCTVWASAMGVVHSGMCVLLHAFYFLITSLLLGRQPKINHLQLLSFSSFLFVLGQLLSPCAGQLWMTWFTGRGGPHWPEAISIIDSTSVWTLHIHSFSPSWVDGEKLTGETLDSNIRISQKPQWPTDFLLLFFFLIKHLSTLWLANYNNFLSEPCNYPQFCRNLVIFF